MRTDRWLLVGAVLAGLFLPGAARAQYWPYYGYWRPVYRPFYRPFYGPFYRPFYPGDWPYRPFWRPPVAYAPLPVYLPPPIAEQAYGIPYDPRTRSSRHVHRVASRPRTPPAPVALPPRAPPGPSHDVFPPERPGD